MTRQHREDADSAPAVQNIVPTSSSTPSHDATSKRSQKSLRLARQTRFLPPAAWDLKYPKFSASYNQSSLHFHGRNGILPQSGSGHQFVSLEASWVKTETPRAQLAWWSSAATKASA